MEPISTRRILRLAAQAVRASPGPFLLIAAVGFGPGALVARANLQLSLDRSFPSAMFMWVTLGVGLVIAHAAIAYGATARLNGRPCSVMDMLSATVMRLPVVVSSFLLCGLATLLGTVALIVPGVLVMVAVFPLGGATVVEARGPIDAIRRSAQLTKGYRGVVFLSICAVSLLAITTCCSLAGCLGTIRVASGEGQPFGGWALLLFAVNFGYTIAVAVAVSAVAGATYHELRRIHRASPLEF